MTTNPIARKNIPAEYYREDEIDLVDLWLVLVKRKTVLAGITVACLLAGLLYVLLVPAKYTYSTTIEIGNHINGQELTLVETPETVLAKLRETYIPQAQQNFLKQNPGSHKVIKIDAEIPKNSQIIVIKSKGPKSEGETQMALQQSIVNMLKKDHDRIIDVFHKATEIQHRKAVARLEELKDDNKLIEERGNRLNEVEALLTKQAKETREDLQETINDRKKILKGTVSEAQATTLLTLDDGIRSDRELLASIDERLHVKLADNRAAIKKQLEDNLRTQATQKDNIAKLKLQLANLRETNSLLPPIRSPKPTGPGKKLIIVLSLIIGLMLGIFTVFIMEFLANARRQAMVQGQSEPGAS
jgi:LPS O-antigen subunit length determinant protein (WzzB/FepE family)